MLPDRFRPLSPDRFFAELDGRHLVVAGIDWSLQVYGICEQQGRRWVQLALTGAGEAFMLTLRVGPRGSAGEVLSALSSWLNDPSDAPQVLSVVA
jgi:hypothetical protein